MSNYLVKTPKNPVYDGKTFGVRFSRGQALVNEYTVDPNLKLSPEQVVERMKTDFGYEIIPLESQHQALAAMAAMEFGIDDEGEDVIREEEARTKAELVTPTPIKPKRLGKKRKDVEPASEEEGNGKT